MPIRELEGRSRRHLILLPAIALLILGASRSGGAQRPPQADGAEQRLVVRMRPTGSPAKDAFALETLAKVFAAERLPVSAGTTVEALSLLRCGRVDQAWMAKFRQLNTDVQGTVDEATTVVAPPCPYWRDKAVVNVPQELSVSHSLLLQMGTQGKLTKEAVAEANKSDVASLEEIQAGAAIELPYAVHFRSYVLNEAYRNDPERALKELRAVEGLVSSVPEEELGLVPEPASGCTPAPADQDWPFPAASVIEALKYNNSRRPRPVRKAVIAVADTGIDADENRLPLNFGREPRATDQIDNDENGYVDDIWGGNMDGQEGLPLRRPEYMRNEHGTHVAGLVLGGLQSPELDTYVRERIEVRVLNLVSRQVIPAVPPIVRFLIRTGSMVEALRYAAEEPAIPIINFSVETDHRDPGISLAIKNTGALVVAAAGNAGRDLDAHESYPAALPDRARLIAVAAHDGVGALTPFSNWGGQTVELAAPGCEIESILPDNRRGKQSGTSQAAPLVSFTAALLYAEGLSIPQIKQRILFTTVFDRARLGQCAPSEACVATEGRLNIEKALRVYQDIVVEREPHGNEQIRFGRIEDDCIVLNGRCEPLGSRVKRVLPGFSDDLAKAWLQSLHKQVQSSNVHMGSAELRFRESGSAASRQIRIADIVDVVPAVFR